MTQTEKVVLPAAMMGPEVHQIFDRLEAGGATVRFVGGCIRDLLIGRAIADYDLATDATPSRVIELLEGKVLKVVPIGFEHGTILAVCRTKSFHITTYSSPVERHYQTKFWESLSREYEPTILRIRSKSSSISTLFLPKISGKFFAQRI